VSSGDDGKHLTGLGTPATRGAVKNTGINAYQHEKKSLGKCPLCGGDVYEGGKNYYCGNYKAEKPCRFTIW
jgi:DNA topoisomerase-3